jgi:coenzyme PQQ precursor peptide PqqA
VYRRGHAAECTASAQSPPALEKNSHENHEVRFKNIPYGRDPAGRKIRQTIDSRLHLSRRLTMKWETPEAVDLRYGMEITMYISNR